MIELALALPLMMALIGLTVDGTAVARAKMAVDAAAAEGARYVQLTHGAASVADVESHVGASVNGNVHIAFQGQPSKNKTYTSHVYDRNAWTNYSTRTQVSSRRILASEDVTLSIMPMLVPGVGRTQTITGVAVATWSDEGLS